MHKKSTKRAKTPKGMKTTAGDRRKGSAGVPKRIERGFQPPGSSAPPGPGGGRMKSMGAREKRLMGRSM